MAQLVGRGELTSDRLSRQREDLVQAVERVVTRAQRSGTARGELAALDFVVVMTLVVRIAAAVESDMWRRYFALLFDGLRAEPTLALPPGPEPTHDSVDRLLGSL